MKSAKNLNLLFGNWISKYPALFFPLITLFGHKKKGRKLIDRSTRIVIEGFPRSANTFAVQAFLLAQGGNISINDCAHHVHKSAQLIRAVQWNIPAILLIRTPEDVIKSILIRQPKYDVKSLLTGYIYFHEPLVKLIDRIVIAPFDQVINEFGTIIEQVNDKYESDFKPFEHTDTNVQAIFNKIEQLDDVRTNERAELRMSRPNQSREKTKEELSHVLHGQEKLLTRATALYRLFLK